MILKQKIIKSIYWQKIKKINWLIVSQGLDIYVFFNRCSKYPPKLSLHSSALFLVCCTIFRISSPSCPRRSLLRSSWAPLEYLAHIWLYVLLLGTKMRSLEATSPGSMGASDELSFVKLFSRQILHEENQDTRPLRGSWRHHAEPILSSCCQVLHWLPDSILEDLF